MLADLRAAKAELSKKFLMPSLQAAHLISEPMRLRRALHTAVRPNPSENVVGVGIGEKLVKGKSTGERVVKLLVQVKFPKSQIADDDLLPPEFLNVQTDVEEVGLFRILSGIPNPRMRMRPARPGCSIGYWDNVYEMAGTFGALVKDMNGGTYALSNNHILADCGRLPVETPICSPGILDDGNPQLDQIARLTRYVPLNPSSLNRVDAAIAEVIDESLVSNAILQIGSPTGATTAQLNTVVQKFGRTSGYTSGVISSVDTDVKVVYDIGNLIVEGQIIIVGLDGSRFSALGDSGSLIVEKTSNLAVGLLFAGSSVGASGYTIASHIGDVLSALNVQLV